MVLVVSCNSTSSFKTLCSGPAPSTNRLSCTVICGAELASLLGQRLRPEQKRRPRISHGREVARPSRALVTARCGAVSSRSTRSPIRRFGRASDCTCRSKGHSRHQPFREEREREPVKRAGAGGGEKGAAHLRARPGRRACRTRSCRGSGACSCNVPARTPAQTGARASSMTCNESLECTN